MNKKASPRSSAINTRREAQLNRPSTASSSNKSSSRSNGFSRQRNLQSQTQTRVSSLLSSRSGSKNNSLSKTHQFTSESFLNDPDCISIRDSLISSDSPDFSDIETPQMLRLLSHLREYTQSCALNEDYKTSKKSRDLANLVRQDLTKRGTKRYSIQEQKDEIEARINNFEEKWSQKREDFSKETEKRMNDLNDRQKHELRRFERIWKEEMPHKYRKPSARLLQLKQIEKNLAMTGEIDEADRIHGISEVRMKYEMEEAQNQLSIDYEAAKAKLFQKQYEEKQKFLELRNHENNLLEASYRDEKAKFNNRNFVITSRCHKVASKTHVSRSVNSLPTTLPRDKGIPLGTLLPPLIPPNDPNYMENKRRKREEIARKKREYQKKNADNVLTHYSMLDFGDQFKDSHNLNESQNVDDKNDEILNLEEEEIKNENLEEEENNNLEEEENKNENLEEEENNNDNNEINNLEEEDNNNGDIDKKEMADSQNPDEIQNKEGLQNENQNPNENPNKIDKSDSAQPGILEQVGLKAANAILGGIVAEVYNHQNETNQES